LLKHCVRAVAPATEFGNPDGHASQLVPFQKRPALQVMVMEHCGGVPVQSPHAGQLLVAPPEHVFWRVRMPLPV